MTKAKFFQLDSIHELEDKVNKFIGNKMVVNISYSVSKVGYYTYHHCCVLYME